MHGDGATKNVNYAWQWKDVNGFCPTVGIFRDADGRLAGDAASIMANASLNSEVGRGDEEIRGWKPTV